MFEKEKRRELSCLLAYEWTSNEYKYDYGHKNIYYRGDDGDIFRSGDVVGMTPFQLFESLKQYDAMALRPGCIGKKNIISALPQEAISPIKTADAGVTIFTT